MNNTLLKIIVCPMCQSKLNYKKKTNELICDFDKISFPIKNGIPILIYSKANILK